MEDRAGEVQANTAHFPIIGCNLILVRADCNNQKAGPLDSVTGAQAGAWEVFCVSWTLLSPRLSRQPPAAATLPESAWGHAWLFNLFMALCRRLQSGDFRCCSHHPRRL